MRNKLLLGAIVAALTTMACGQDSQPSDGTDAGGASDAGQHVDAGENLDAGSNDAGARFASRAEACGAIADKWATCGADPTGLAQTCIDDATMTDERTSFCAACTVDVTCDQLGNLGCYSACQPARADVVFRGEGLGAWVGKTVNIEVTDPTGQPLMDVGLPLTILDDGTFRQQFFQLLPEGGHVQVRFWADLDGDATCGSAVDRHAVIDVPELLTGAEFVFTPSLTDEPSICSGFKWVAGNLVFHATGLDAVPDGAKAVVNLMSSFGGSEYPASSTQATVTDGAFTADFHSSITRDSDFVVHWFVDADNTNTCDATDLGGTSSFHSTPGTVTIDATPDTGAPECSLFFGWGYTLSFGATGFDVANGHNIRAFLVDATTGDQLATTWGYVSEGAFSLDFTDMVPGGYDVELVYLADVDDSQACNQPADLVGRVHVGLVSADATTMLPAASDNDATTCSQVNALLAP